MYMLCLLLDLLKITNLTERAMLGGADSVGPQVATVNSVRPNRKPFSIPVDYGARCPGVMAWPC